MVKMQNKKSEGVRGGVGWSGWMCTKNYSYCENVKKSGGSGGGVGWVGWEGHCGCEIEVIVNMKKGRGKSVQGRGGGSGRM